MADVKTGRRRSGHLSEEDWVDFVRGQGGEPRSTGVARHLAAGCLACERTLRFWKAVLGLAGQEASYEPPEGVVGQAKAQFALHRPPSPASRLARTASLVFDGFRQPLFAGVRAAGSAPLQLAFKAAHCMVMLRVEPTAGSDRLSVVGQIVDESNPDRSLRDVGVFVLRAGEAVERTLTNQLGEFQLETDPAQSLQISVGIPEMGVLTTPLPFGGKGASGRAARVAQASDRKSKARRR